MANKQQQTEWFANADLCRKMADRSHDPGLRARWLTLAQQWMTLCDSAREPQSDTEGFGAAVHYEGKGRPGSTSTH